MNKQKSLDSLGISGQNKYLKFLTLPLSGTQLGPFPRSKRTGKHQDQGPGGSGNALQFSGLENFTAGKPGGLQYTRLDRKSVV